MHETKIGKFVLPHDFKSIQKMNKVSKFFFEKIIKLTCLEIIHVAVLGVWYMHASLSNKIILVGCLGDETLT